MDAVPPAQINEPPAWREFGEIRKLGGKIFKFLYGPPLPAKRCLAMHNSWRPRGGAVSQRMAELPEAGLKLANAEKSQGAGAGSDPAGTPTYLRRLSAVHRLACRSRVLINTKDFHQRLIAMGDNSDQPFLHRVPSARYSIPGGQQARGFALRDILGNEPIGGCSKAVTGGLSASTCG